MSRAPGLQHPHIVTVLGYVDDPPGACGKVKVQEIAMDISDREEGWIAMDSHGWA